VERLVKGERGNWKRYDVRKKLTEEGEKFWGSKAKYISTYQREREKVHQVL